MKKTFPMLTLGLVAMLFGAGVIYLFLLRFETGDVYPPYSSFRADPLGTMAWFESLQRIPDLKVSRDLSSNSKLPENKDTTYLHLAAAETDWEWLAPDLLKDIETFATRGGRLVVTMYPVNGRGYFPPVLPPTPIVLTNTASTNAPVSKSNRKVFRKKSRSSSDDLLNRVSLQKRWGVEFGRIPLPHGDHGAYQSVPVENQTDLPLPEKLAWHSALVLTNLDASWRIVYARSNNAVMIERKFGRGSIVIATDSYFLSNEALWKDREPHLLAWLIGPAAHVIFDEAHLGVLESTGVAVLMHRYRLTGLIGALVVLALLFIWKNSTSLVPPHADPAATGYVPGRDATAGFVNLLRRNIPAREILNVLFDEWTKALVHRRNVRISSVDQAQTIMEQERIRPATSRRPVQTYREIAQALKHPNQTAARPTPEKPHSAPTT